jgi:hypothetical protein
MVAWYSKVRDTELKDGSVRATYVVTFETDNAELKREVEKYLQGIMDKTENCSEKPNNYEPKICYTCRYYNSNIPCGTTPDVCKKADKFAKEFVHGRKKLKPQTEPQTGPQTEHKQETRRMIKNEEERASLVFSENDETDEAEGWGYD